MDQSDDFETDRDLCPLSEGEKGVIGLKKKKKTLSLRIMCVFGPILTAVFSDGVSLKT